MYLELGDNIKELRKQKGLRQEQLAEAMGVSAASVSKWETNQCCPELTVLAELADFFEVSIDTLIGHTLNADRLEALIALLEKSADDRQEEATALLCEKLLRNYPNSNRAVEACADSYYKLFIYTNKNIYMENCIEQTKRLMTLNQGEPESERLARIHFLGNQYELLNRWDIAKEYYEQSNVSGSSDASIASCLLKQGKTQEAIVKLSGVLTESIFHQYQAINYLADGWSELGETDKACESLEWMYGVMESLRYNPTTMLLTQIKLAGLYNEYEKKESAESAIRKAAELVRENKRQEIEAEAGFLRIEQARKMLVSSENNRELLMNFVSLLGGSFEKIVEEILQ